MESPGAADRAMAVRGNHSHGAGKKPSSADGNQPGDNRRPDLSKIQCFNCHKMGHYRSDCTKPDRRKDPKEGEDRKKPEQPTKPSSDVSSEGSSDSEGSTSGREKKPKRMLLVRTLNSFSALTDDEDELSDTDGDKDESAAPSERAFHVKAQDSKRKKSSKSPTPPKDRRQESTKKKSTELSVPVGTPTSLDEALRSTSKAVDSGATACVTGNKDCLINMRRCSPRPLLMANDAVVNSVWKGDMPLRLKEAGTDKIVRILIRNVYFHESIEANLLSWGDMRLDGWEFHSDLKGTHLITPKGTRIQASTRGRMTVLDDAGPERLYATRLGRAVCRDAEELLAMHRRVGHVSWDKLVKMCKSTEATAGVGSIDKMSSNELKKAEGLVKQCEACIAGKLKRNALGHRGLDMGTTAGEVLHMDTFYVMMRDPQTRKKYREYCLVASCGFTKAEWVAKTTSLRALQDEAIAIIRSSTTMAGRRPRLIVTDPGTEFANGKVEGYCRKRGMTLQQTPARAKEMNGLAEKRVDKTKNHARAMMEACKITDQLGWWHAVSHHTYLWNRTHISPLTGKTPYEAMTGRKPSIMHVGVFGCDAWVHQDRLQRDTTFSPKALPGIYLGHDSERNCAVVRMVHTGKKSLCQGRHFQGELLRASSSQRYAGRSTGRDVGAVR